MHVFLIDAIKHNDLDRIALLAIYIPLTYAKDRDLRNLKAHLWHFGGNDIELDDGGDYVKYLDSIIQGDNVERYCKKFIREIREYAEMMDRPDCVELLLPLEGTYE